MFRLILAFIGIILIIDSMILLSIGSINFGTMLPFFIGMAFAVHGLWWHNIRRLCAMHSWLNELWYGLWSVFGMWLVSFIIFAITLQQQINQAQQTIPHVKAIMVLGAGIKEDKPSPLLAERLDTAAQVFKAQPQSLIITSGGKGVRDNLSSGQVMANYLISSHNIASHKILVEGKSTSTAENFSLSQPILTDHGITLSDPIAVVTSDFHIIRSKAIAKHQGYAQPVMVASSTPLSIRYNAWFREYFAFISGWLLNEY